MTYLPLQDTKKYVAVKSIDLARTSNKKLTENLKEEIKILMRMNHVNIVKLLHIEVRCISFFFRASFLSHIDHIYRGCSKRMASSTLSWNTAREVIWLHLLESEKRSLKMLLASFSNKLVI